MRLISRIVCTSFAFFLTCCAKAQNLLVNGDFSAGNTGFISQYNYKAPPANSQGQYWVGNNPNSWYAPHPSFFDHTLGTASGSMLIADGAAIPAPNQPAVWSQTVPVVAGAGYRFSFWLANVAIGNGGTATPQIEVRINGIALGAASQASGIGLWQFFERSWNSGVATSATIELVDLNTARGGNDFALDDLSFTAAPEPGALVLVLLGLPLLRCRNRHK